MTIDSPHAADEVLDILYFTLFSAENSKVMVDVFERDSDDPIKLVRIFCQLFLSLHPNFGDRTLRFRGEDPEFRWGRATSDTGSFLAKTCVKTKELGPVEGLTRKILPPYRRTVCVSVCPFGLQLLKDDISAFSTDVNRNCNAVVTVENIPPPPQNYTPHMFWLRQYAMVLDLFMYTFEYH